MRRARGGRGDEGGKKKKGGTTFNYSHLIRILAGISRESQPTIRLSNTQRTMIAIFHVRRALDNLRKTLIAKPQDNARIYILLILSTLKLALDSWC